MGKMKQVLLALCLMVAAYPSVFAQASEVEPVEKYRKSMDFTMPDPGKPADGPVRIGPIDPGSGEVGVHYLLDDNVRKLLDVHRRRNEAAEEAPGFRIQIYAGSDQNIANSARADFLARFYGSDMEIHQTWDPPHFRVRVGDFRTRAEAMRELPNVRRIFPDGFVVSDVIKLRKTKRSSAAQHAPEIPEEDGGPGPDNR
jgi:hypothetical protein